MNGRTFFALAFNSAGIVNTATTVGALGAQSNTMNANGMRANQNNVQIDGITSMDGVQKVIRRPLDKRLAYGLSALGTLLLFSLIGYIMYADIVRIAQ